MAGVFFLFFFTSGQECCAFFFFSRACRHTLEVNMRLLNLIVMLKLLALEAFPSPGVGFISHTSELITLVVHETERNNPFYVYLRANS